MAHLLSAVTLLSLLVIPLPAQEAVSELLGTWTLDRARSAAAAKAGMETRIDLTRVQFEVTPTALVVTRWAGAITLTTAYDVAGAPADLMGLHQQLRRSALGWEGTALVIAEEERIAQPVGEALVRVTERWTPQADGSLRLEVTSVTGASTLTRTVTFVREGR